MIAWKANSKSSGAKLINNRLILPPGPAYNAAFSPE